MKKIIMISVLASLALTGCGDPKDEASEIAQQACIADKNSDIASLNRLMNEEMYEMNKSMHQGADPEIKRMLKMLNCDFIWIHDAVTVLEATFSHTMNTMGTKTLVVEMGVGMRLTKNYGYQLLNGILNLMKEEGIIQCEEEFENKEAFSSEIGDVFYLNAPTSGLFIPSLDHCAIIKKGDKIGDIVDPLKGKILATLEAPNDGILFTLREYPVVYEGSLLARIFGEKSE